MKNVDFFPQQPLPQSIKLQYFLIFRALSNAQVLPQKGLFEGFLLEGIEKRTILKKITIIFLLIKHCHSNFGFFAQNSKITNKPLLKLYQKLISDFLPQCQNLMLVAYFLRISQCFENVKILQSLKIHISKNSQFNLQGPSLPFCSKKSIKNQLSILDIFLLLAHCVLVESR